MKGAERMYTKEYFELAGINGFFGNAWGTKWKAYTKLRYKRYIKLTRHIWGKGRNKILDIGCCNGDFLNMLYKYNKRNDLYGIDCSLTVVSQIRNKKIHAYNYSVDEIPSSFTDYFDLCFCCGTIFYCQSYDASFSNIARCMNKEGLFLLEFNNDFNTFDRNKMIKSLKKYFSIKEVYFEYGKWYIDFFSKEWNESYAIKHESIKLWIRTLILLSNKFIAYLFEYFTYVVGDGELGKSGTIFLCEVKDNSV